MERKCHRGHTITGLQCQTCKNERNRALNKRDPGYFGKKRSEERKVNRSPPKPIDNRKQVRLLIDLFYSNGCVLCEETDEDVLQAHHVHSKDKLISRMVANNHLALSVKAELEKCIPLCANCHIRVHRCSQKNLEAIIASRKFSASFVAEFEANGASV